jgi:hypothetical protein
LEINGSGMVDSGSQTDKVVAKQLSAVEKESIATSSTFQSFLKKVGTAILSFGELTGCNNLFMVCFGEPKNNL